MTEPIANDLGYPAWSISTSTLNSIFDYQSGPLTAAQKADINSQGFTLTLRARALQGNAPAYDAGSNTLIGGAVLDLESKAYDLLLGINSSGNTVAALLTYYDYGGPGGSLRGYGPSYTLNDAGYHTYDLVFNPNTQSATLFIDGVERISEEYTGNSIAPLNRGLLFGALSGGGMNFNLVRLTSPAVVPGLTCTEPPMGLVSWWPGDGSANDIAGPNNGILQGAATFGAGIVGQTFVFDGSAGTEVLIPDNPSLNPSTAFTIEGWINTISL